MVHCRGVCHRRPHGCIEVESPMPSNKGELPEIFPSKLLEDLS
jgi:hypothetical protein